MKSQLIGVTLVAAALGTLAGVLAKAQAAPAAPGCTLQTVKGAYMFRTSGTVPDKVDTLSIGVMVFDGAGHVRGVHTASFGGMIQPKQDPFEAGTYSLDADCTGTMSFTAPRGAQYPSMHTNVVVGDGGRRMIALVTDAGYMLAFEGVKQ